MKLQIILHPNRDRCGALALLDDTGACLFGPVPVAARAGDGEAAAHGNLARSVLLPYGDPPLGSYRMQHIIRPRGNGWYPRAAFGPHGVVLLRPSGGPAALAEANGRFDFFIQGGAAGRRGLLQAVSNGFRLRNRDLRELLARLDGIADLVCDCIEDINVIATGFVDTDPGLAAPALPFLAATPRSMPRRRVLAGFGAASGAMAVSLSGMFVGLAAPTIAFAQDAYPSGGGAYPNGGPTSSIDQSPPLYDSQAVTANDAPPPPRIDELPQISGQMAPPRYDEQPGMVSQTPPPPRYDEQPGMVSQTPAPPRYDEQPGMVSQTPPPDYSQAPPGSFLNSTQTGGPPDFSTFPPGSFLDSSQQSQPTSASANTPVQPDYSQAPPGSFLNSTQNGGPPDYSLFPPGSFLTNK